MAQDNDASSDWGTPHAFHLNLPPNHFDDDGVPYITKFAHKKARMIVDLALSINLTEDLFAQDDGVADDAMDIEEEDNENSKKTLASLITTCNRLQSQLSILESLKHSGIEQEELCEIILHLLRLLSTTVTYEPDLSDPSKPLRRKPTLHYENVGYLYRSGDDDSSLVYRNPSDEVQLEEELTHEFAMPAPAREILLFFLINLLGNKGPLRSVSNASVYVEGEENENSRKLLILHWKPLLRMFLRTAPYLDEHKVGKVPSVSNSRQSTTLQRTVQLIRDARHFFDQGFRPPSATPLPHLEMDRTAKEIWNMVKTDVKYHSHTHACYRSSIILYLFQPSRCSAEYYLDVLPQWYECWTNIDRCPEYDFLWLAMFCRARKHLATEAFDWGPIRRRILTHSQYWLQLPIGGASMDKLFPRAGNPRSRSCPSRLKEFVGSGSSYEEGIDFVAKVTKLLVASLGTGEMKPASSADSFSMSEGTRDMLRFLSYVTPYFNPSNLGSWTFTLGAFLHYFSYELCCRVGNSAAMDSMKLSNPGLYASLCGVQPALGSAAIPEREMVALMDALLPLCQQAMYSKNGHVGRAGEAAMLYLIQIDPMHTAPAFIDFATRALDISAVNLAHQAPAALSALTRLVQPGLRSNPSILLARIPDILRLCLAGIDRNDQNKTIRTLILYRSITSWMPVGGQPDKWITVDVDKIANAETSELTSSNGTTHLGRHLFKYLSDPRMSPEYLVALDQLSPTSLLKQGIPSDNDTSPETQKLLMEEAAAAMDDWILEFLDRIFTFLRASGEREKAGKTSSGVASRHSSVDVQQARNFSRVLQECLAQVFASLNGSVYKLALRAVTRFFQEDTLPWASKDASFVCQAVAGAREIQDDDGKTVLACPGLDALVPILTDDLRHHSIKTVAYRLRCLAGAVKGSSHVLVKHREAISKSIDFALASNDKHLFKVGCKLLRHTLASLCEAYPVAMQNMPRTATDSSSAKVLGRSAQLAGDGVQWHVPNEESIDFASSLLKRHILQRLETLSTSGADDVANGSVDIPELRRCLRVIRYSLRGGSCILLDKDEFVADASNSDDLDATLTPHELASQNILKLASDETRQSLSELRGRMALFVVAVASLIANETYSAFSPDMLPTNEARYQSLISTDAKICKETCDIALLLLTRRGANFRSQEARNIWKAQKQSTTDFSLCAMADHIVESLQRGALYCKGSEIFYKDGEDAGKTIPRRLLVTRVKLFHDSLKRNASFEIPRRLRRLNYKRASSGVIIFDPSMKTSDLGSKISQILCEEAVKPLVGYEGLMDGLFSLCCHSNTQVRAAAISVVDYAITRFGWLVKHRVPRLLSAVSMEDADMHGKFGIPSTFKLKTHVDGQGKRKRLAEAMKGVISLLALPRSVKEMMASDEVRLIYIKTACGTDELISLMPTEETQKMVHYLHSIFSKFRSKFYSLPRTSVRDQDIHDSSINFLLDLLSENEGKLKVDVLAASASDQDPKSSESSDQSGISVAQAHWRKLLLVCWFIMSQVNGDDLKKVDSSLSTRLWNTCFRVLENEMGQPLQRVALGLFGRLVALSHSDTDLPLLRAKMTSEPFCKVLGKALVYDHKEDSNFGGGHDAQWSAGVEDMIRDASRNVAPRTLFPFQRTSQSSTTFKITHAQLVYQVVAALGPTDGTTAAKYLLSFATEIAASPPSEDQRNQQCTSAELFSGVCRAMLQLHRGDGSMDIWKAIFLPYLEEVIPKIPVSFIGSYFDSLRFALQFSPPNAFFPLTEWLFAKVEATLWQPKNTPEIEADGVGEEKNGAGNLGRAEGFTAQSKWLYLSCALLIEIDETEVDGTMSRVPWYTHSLIGDSRLDAEAHPEQHAHAEDLQKSWDLVNQKLLPRLVEAVGHPYESCRDHIAGCLFRICHCHRKKMRVTASRSFDADMDDGEEASSDPGSVIVKKLASLESTDTLNFNDRYNALITTRRFFSYCIHLGEAKHEYSDYIIPLLPLAFEALKSNVEDGSDSADAAKRTLEAEVVKGYRYTIAELSVTSVISYGDFSDITRVLDIVQAASEHEKWQVRHACAHFLRSFQGSHKFLFSSEHAEVTLSIITLLLADDRREVSSAAMSTLTGILAASPVDDVAKMVKKYVLVAKRSAMKRKKKGSGRLTPPPKASPDSIVDQEALEKEQKRATNQLTSVFFLCASILAQPYETPPYVPEALAAISKHSFERNAPLGVRDTVKKCCAEYKRTHMSDNWELHRSKFSQEQLEALEDVVSSPHYYA